MKIAIDIDGTLNDNVPFIVKRVKKYAKKNNIKIKIDLTKYDFLGKFGWDQQTDDKFWDEEAWVYAKGIKAKKGASKVVQKLKKDGHEIFILTARWMTTENTPNGEKMRNYIKKWLKKHKIVYDGIIYVPTHASKKEHFLKEQFDMLIDDKPSHIEDVSMSHPVICMEEDYNKYLQFNENVYKCKTWKQVYKVIKQLNVK